MSSGKDCSRLVPLLVASLPAKTLVLLASTGSHSFPPHFINTKSRAESGTLCGNLSWTVSYIPRTITRHLILSPAASIDAGIQATSAPSLWLQPGSAYVVGSHQSRPSAYNCATHAGNTIQHYSAPVRSITHHRPPVHQPFSQPGPDLDPPASSPCPQSAKKRRTRSLTIIRSIHPR
ncbi:hypothetical protein CEP54_008361 [Fusarium duplospermum]|uniref:Uncharacterized protein n=1 Tax=Fusarium duplospermum TaxID=1325734 RepID=A0A428PW44_9HYPO|nr:hypothetical protein CEP54_008361 [Fusarium duplospermum]